MLMSSRTRSQIRFSRPCGWAWSITGPTIAVWPSPVARVMPSNAGTWRGLNSPRTTIRRPSVPWRRRIINASSPLIVLPSCVDDYIHCRSFAQVKVTAVGRSGEQVEPAGLGDRLGPGGASRVEISSDSAGGMQPGRVPNHASCLCCDQAAYCAARSAGRLHPVRVNIPEPDGHRPVGFGSLTATDRSGSGASARRRRVAGARRRPPATASGQGRGRLHARPAAGRRLPGNRAEPGSAWPPSSLPLAPRRGSRPPRRPTPPGPAHEPGWRATCL